MSFLYWIAVPAYIFLIITSSARLADLGPTDWKMRHHVRRVGLAFVGTVAATFLVTPFTNDHNLYPEPSWRLPGLAWGVTLTWLTTEGQPPWYDFIVGAHRTTEEWKCSNWSNRLRLEVRALRESFRPRRRRNLLSGKGPPT